MKYFCSDLHVGHTNILKHDHRPFKDVHEMNETIIKNINNTCSKKDDLFIIGDFSWYGVARTKEIVDRLNPRIIIVRGNHDKHARQLINMGVHQVYENHFIFLGDAKKKIKVFLSHYPYYPNWWHRFKLLFNKYKGWKRYTYKKMVREGEWLLHGHIHNQKVLIKDKMINVTINKWGYFPISEKTIIDIIEGRYTDQGVKK